MRCPSSTLDLNFCFRPSDVIRPERTAVDRDLEPGRSPPASQVPSPVRFRSWRRPRCRSRLGARQVSSRQPIAVTRPLSPLEAPALSIATWSSPPGLLPPANCRHPVRASSPRSPPHPAQAPRQPSPHRPSRRIPLTLRLRHRRLDRSHRSAPRLWRGQPAPGGSGLTVFERLSGEMAAGCVFVLVLQGRWMRWLMGGCLRGAIRRRGLRLLRGADGRGRGLAAGRWRAGLESR
jgi:hypothetical protein